MFQATKLARKIGTASVVVLSLARAVAQDTSPPTNLAWQDVAPAYKRFDEIKPVLVNNGPKSVFLSRLYPNSFAHLQRLSEATGEWESGEWSVTCGTVSQATVPIEVKARAQKKIQVYWQLSTDDTDEPKHFIVGALHDERPIAGTYRFVLDYALQPWTVVQRPKATYTVVSPEFIVGSP